MKLRPHQLVLHNKRKGKVIAFTKDTATVEFIVSYDETTRQRTTKLETVKVTELRPFEDRRNVERQPLEVNIKYFDKYMPRIAEIAIGDLIDLRSRERIEYKKGDYFIIPLGVAMDIPQGWKADLVPRSSTFKNWRIIQTNSVGKIDNSYNGDDDEWGMPVYALEDGVIEKHDRVCQFEIVRKMPKFKFNEVESLKNPSRGGFGSTGKN